MSTQQAPLALRATCSISDSLASVGQLARLPGKELSTLGVSDVTFGPRVLKAASTLRDIHTHARKQQRNFDKNGCWLANMPKPWAPLSGRPEDHLSLRYRVELVSKPAPPASENASAGNTAAPETAATACTRTQDAAQALQLPRTRARRQS